MYYDRANRAAILPGRHDPMNPLHVDLPPEHLFWQPLDIGFEYTYDGQDIPNGVQPIVLTITETVSNDLIAAGINSTTLTRELFKDSQALPNDLATIYATIQAIAIARSITDAEVLDVLG